MSKSSDCRIPDFLDESGIASLFGRLTDRRLGTRAFNDYDLYLVQHDVWPLLLEGLDELARKVAFNAEREGRDDFNALKWLGQYLSRNHPTRAKQVSDVRRQVCFERLRHHARVEKGRRAFLRRKAPLEEVFTRYIADKGDSALTVSTDEWAAFLAHVDSEWFLEGAFAGRFAATAEAVVQPQVVPPTLLELEDGACAAGREQQTKKCKVAQCEAKDYDHGERPAQDEVTSVKETPVVEPGIVEKQQRGGAASVTPAQPPSWRFPQLWQHLRREIETPVGAIDLAIFEKGERLREQHAAKQHRDRTLQAKSRIVDIWKQRKRVLVENFSGVAAKLREDLGETLDYDFVFPRTPPESGGTETLFRELLQLWKDGWLFRQKMNSLSGGEGATAGAGWMSATSTAVGAAGGGTADNVSKATWATVVKFFRSLKVAVTETDFELLSKLLVWRSYEDVVGVGPVFEAEVQQHREPAGETRSNSTAPAKGIMSLAPAHLEAACVHGDDPALKYSSTRTSTAEEKVEIEKDFFCTAGMPSSSPTSASAWPVMLLPIEQTRRITVKVAEEDQKLLAHLINIAGTGQGEGATGGVLLVTLRPDGCTVDGFQIATRN